MNDIDEMSFNVDNYIFRRSHFVPLPKSIRHVDVLRYIQIIIDHNIVKLLYILVKRVHGFFFKKKRNFTIFLCLTSCYSINQ